MAKTLGNQIGDWYDNNRSQGMSSESVYDVGQSDKYGSKYSSLVSANPYANMDYRKSWWQNVLTGLGFRTNYDAYRESMALQAKEYDAAIAEKAHNEEFDSPAAQAQRMRQAGINPDINGDVSGGSSSPLRDDGNPAIAPEADDAGFITNVAGSLISGVESLFGMVSSGCNLFEQFQDIRGKSLDNDNKELDNTLKLFLDASLPDDYNQGADSDGSNYHWRFGWDKHSRLYQLLGYRAKKYAKGVNLFRQSLIGQEQEAGHRVGRANNRRAFASIRGRSTYSEFDDVLDAFEGAISDLALDVETTGYQKETFQNVYDAEYTQSLDPAAMAGAAQSTAQAEATAAGANSRLAVSREKAKNSIDDLTKHLEGLANDGNIWARLGSIVANYIKVKMFGL